MNANICMQSFALQKISYHVLSKSFRHYEPLLLLPLAPCFAIISTFPLSSSFSFRHCLQAKVGDDGNFFPKLRVSANDQARYALHLPPMPFLCMYRPPQTPPAGGAPLDPPPRGGRNPPNPPTIECGFS